MLSFLFATVPAYWLGAALLALVALVALAAMTIKSGYSLRIRSTPVDIELTPPAISAAEEARPKLPAERP